MSEQRQHERHKLFDRCKFCGFKESIWALLPGGCHPSEIWFNTLIGLSEMDKCDACETLRMSHIIKHMKESYDNAERMAAENKAKSIGVGDRFLIDDADWEVVTIEQPYDEHGAMQEPIAVLKCTCNSAFPLYRNKNKPIKIPMVKLMRQQRITY